MYKDIGAQKFEVIEYTTDELIKVLQKEIKDGYSLFRHFDSEFIELFNVENNYDVDFICDTINSKMIDSIIKMNGVSYIFENIQNDSEELLYKKRQILNSLFVVLQEEYFNKTLNMFSNLLYLLSREISRGYVHFYLNIKKLKCVEINRKFGSNKIHFVEYSYTLPNINHEYLEEYFRKDLTSIDFLKVLFNDMIGAYVEVRYNNLNDHNFFLKNMSNKLNTHFENNCDNFDEYLIQMKYYNSKIGDAQIIDIKDKFMIIDERSLY